MKILSAEQIREWDKATILAQGIGSETLMERAAYASTDWITAHYGNDTPFLIVCGTGNNGGDGLAIARMLIERGYSVATFVLKPSAGMSLDCRTNFEALKKVPGAVIESLEDGKFITEIPQSIVIVDALFGTGLNRPATGYYAEFIKRLNELPNIRISIDLPSGLFPDEIPDNEQVIVKAQQTLTFQQYKKSMMVVEGGSYCGWIRVLDIRLDAGFQDNASSVWQTLERQDVRDIYKPRKAFSHKGTYGTVMMIGGSYGMMGAPILATMAAGRVGAGKVRSLLPACGYEIAQTLAPEAMCMTSGERCLEDMAGWESAEGIGIGPGMGTEDTTVAAFGRFLKAVQRPIVLDADALNILSKHPDWLNLLPKNSIITPHPKELERLFGQTTDSARRNEMVRTKAVELQIVIVAKDTHTLVALPDGNCYYNITGNAGLATGGSGDVLCGMIAGLLAQGYSPVQAALLGVFLHGIAGELAAGEKGLEAVVAGDIINGISGAYRFLAAE